MVILGVKVLIGYYKVATCIFNQIAQKLFIMQQDKLKYKSLGNNIKHRHSNIISVVLSALVIILMQTHSGHTVMFST